MDFISSSNTNSRKGKVHTASVPTASVQVFTASTDVAAVSLSHDIVCAYIASQLNGSQIKYKDITQIDKDDIKEMDIKWNMALSSMRADRFWKKTGKKITIKGSDVASFDKLKDWSYMANEEENYALVADDEVLTEFALMAKSSSSSENKVEARLVEFKEQEIKFCEKIRGLERYVEVRNNKIEYLVNKLEQVKKEKEGLDNKLTGFESASKDLDNLLGNQRSDKNKEGLGYNTGNSQNNIDDKGYWDSGCSRHMTGNISYLSDILFTDSECIVLGKDFKLKDDTNVLLRTPRQHNIYSIDLNNIVPHKNLTCLVAKASVDESMLWHRRLGHLNFKTMNKLVRNNLVKGLPFKCFENDHTYVDCLKGKKHKVSCKTKFTWTFFLRTKDETSSILRNFITKIENLKDLKVKIIRCDNRGEFKNKEMNEFCTKKGIRREFSNARTPRILVNKSQNKTPYELFNNRIPAIGFLRPFGCHVMIFNTLDHLEKFDAKGDEGYFVKYSMSSKAFRVFNKRTKKVEENPHVDFLENKLIEKGAGPNWLFDVNTLTNSMNYVPMVVAGTSSTNISGTKDVASQNVKKDVSSLRYIALLNWFHEAHMDTRNCDAPDGCNTDVPKNSGISNPTASLKVPSADQVEPAISITVESEIPTISLHIPTVCLDNSPESSSGPRLISKGDFSQNETPSLGNALTLLDRFEDTIRVEANLSNIESSIPVSPTPTFRIHKDHPKSQIIGLVDTPIQTIHKSKEMEEHSFIAIIHQKTNPNFLQFCLFLCFLSHKEPKKILDALKDPRVRPIGTKWDLKNKKDEKEIVIRNKARLVAQGGLCDAASKVEKAMYRLSQVPRAWYGTLSKYLLNNGFQRGTIDQTLFIRKHKGEFLLVQVYVDDIIFGSLNPQLCREFKALMHDKFQISAMDVRSANTPMDKENPWGKDGPGKDVELHLHQVTPKECHLYAVKRIFRYLKVHLKLGLRYPKESPFDLVAYSDSDYGGSTQDRKSTTRGCQFLRRRLISWQCKKQTIMATSTTEAEYVAAASGCG
nr:hypothetical protein [Tanacetum cinerariifolium]